MVRIIVAVVVALLVVAGGTAYASQASLPGDALYPIKIGTEQAGMMLPGDDVGRAERGLGFADRRIVEIEALAEQGRSEYLGLAGEKYEQALNMTLARIEEATNKGLAAGNATGNVTARVAEATLKHMEVLADVHDKVPEQAQEAIKRAMNVSVAGHEAALQALERAGVDLSQLPGIPDEVWSRLEDILGDAMPPRPGVPDGVPPSGPPAGVPPADQP
ncbi:MAG: DUF5667 domain-containing protein [Dehalococcoidia bacterium]